MDYEKKYNEALNWMRELYPGLHGATKEDAEHYFPELRESEDERISKLAIDRVRNATIMTEGLRELLLTYLEKQKEQKPAEWSLQDARPGDVLTTGAVTFIFKSADGDFANAYCYFSEMTGKFDISETADIYLKYVQPASIEQRVRLYEHLLRYIRIHTQEEHWKPSEEDEKILHAIELHINQLDSGETINGFSSSDMLRVLKQLKEL